MHLLIHLQGIDIFLLFTENRISLSFFLQVSFLYLCIDIILMVSHLLFIWSHEKLRRCSTVFLLLYIKIQLQLKALNVAGTLQHLASFYFDKDFHQFRQ